MENVENQVEGQVEGQVQAEVAVVAEVKRKQVSTAVFVDAWERNIALANEGLIEDGIQAVATELGLTRTTVVQRSSALRNPKANAKGQTPAAIPLTMVTNRGPRTTNGVGRAVTAAIEVAANFADLQAKAKAAAEAAKAAKAAEAEESAEIEESVEVEAEGELVGAGS